MTVINFQNNDFSDMINSVTPFNTLASIVGNSMAAVQMSLEHESYMLGEERFRKALERQIERGEVCNNAVARPLLDTLIPALSEHIVTFMETKGRGRPHVAKQYLSQIAADKAACITIKTCLAVLAREESAPIQVVAMRVANNIEDEIRYGRIREQEAAFFKKYIEKALDQRQGEDFKKAYLSVVERNMMADGDLKTTHEAWPQDARFHVGVVLLEKLIESTGMVTLERRYAGQKDKDHQAVTLSPAYVEKLTARAGALAGINPLHQPMVVPPKPWENVTGGGYWAKGRRPLALVRTGGKGHLKRIGEVEMPNVYKAVNYIQNTPWRINADVLAVANAVTGWKHCPVADIPSLDKAELPEKPEDIDTNSHALKAWKKAAAAVYRKESQRQSRRLALEFSLAQANKFSKFDAIWFPYNLDWRGRVYAVPMFNPQGNDLTKGMLHFAQGMKLGADGAYWLAVHGANCAGVDKVSLDDRVKWVHDHESEIVASAESPLDCTWWAEQDSPFCFLAFCFDYAGYIKSGRSEDYESHLPLAFDGTCSGLQHFSAMLRDEVGGAAVNLLPADKPQDVYGIVAAKVNKVLEHDAVHGTEDSVKTVTDKTTGEITEKAVSGTKTLAQQWLAFGVGRGVTKRSVMTLAYGSKQYGFAEQVLEDTINPAIDNGKGIMFTAPNQSAQYMAKLIWDSVSVTVVAAVTAMEWLQKAALLVSSEVKDKSGQVVKPALPVHWTTPVGFPVWSEYKIEDQKRIDCIILGTQRIAPTINMGTYKKIDAKAQASGIAPNFVHSMDASHLMLTAVKGHDVYGITSFAMIHDSFGCHAGNAGKLFPCVRETMVETYEEHDVIQEFYEEFYDQLHGDQLEKMPPIPRKGTLDIREILKSNYTFS